MIEIGEVLVSEHYDPASGRRIHIDRADPRAEISGELLRQIAADECEPYAVITNERPDLVVTLTDDYGQRFLYRIGQRDTERDVYEMEWPD